MQSDPVFTNEHGKIALREQFDFSEGCTVLETEKRESDRKEGQNSAD
jgi:hypothetical protein